MSGISREDPRWAQAEEISARVWSRFTVQYPFWGRIVLMAEREYVEDEAPFRAGVTEGPTIYLRIGWWLTFDAPGPSVDTDASIEQRMATVLHEILHVAMLYWARQGSRTVRVRPKGGGPSVPLWNIAHDYAINLVAEDMHQAGHGPSVRAIPGGVVYDERFRDLPAEAIYDLLLAEADPSPGSEGEEVTLPGLAGAGADADALEGDGRQQPGTSEELGMDEATRWAVAWAEAAQTHERARQAREEIGELPGSMRKFLDRLLKPQVSWREALAQWVGDQGGLVDYSYRRPNRREYGAGVILAGRVPEGLPELVLIVDTSGSMGSREEEILSEVSGIAQTLSMPVRLVQCDTEVRSDGLVEEEARGHEVVGGGGSDLRPAFQLLAEEGFEGLIVVFTDGYIQVPSCAPFGVLGTLWVLWASHQDQPPASWGSVLWVDQDGIVRH
jgi:predicted metal-dependent peptidase